MFCKATAIPGLFSMDSSSRCAHLLVSCTTNEFSILFSGLRIRTTAKIVYLGFESTLSQVTHSLTLQGPPQIALGIFKGLLHLFQIEYSTDKITNMDLQFSRHYTCSAATGDQIRIFLLDLLHFKMADLTLNLSDAAKTLQPCPEHWEVCSRSFIHFTHRSLKFSWEPKDNETVVVVTAQVIEKEEVTIHHILSSYFIQPTIQKASAKTPLSFDPGVLGQ